MQQIDNDMDDLLRSAGQNYPLKTDDSNWDAVLGKLQHGELPPASSNPGSNRSFRRFTWSLLLLIPAAVWVFSEVNNGTVAAAPRAQGKNIASNSSQDVRRSETSPDQNSALPNTNKKRATDNSKMTTDQQQQYVKKEAEPASLNPERNWADNKRVLPNNVIEKKPGSARKSHGVLAGQSSKRPGPDKKYKHEVSGIDPELSKPGFGSDEMTFKAYPTVPLAEYGKQAVDLPAPSIRELNGAKAEKLKLLNPERGWYLGVQAGPDLSTVKYQKIKNAGYSAGIAVGYRFNRHWALEGGLLWNRKDYYSSGKYFDKTRTNIPPNVTLAHLDGWCQMFEIPLALRYRFFVNKSAFFVSTGLNSYLMKKEDYYYKAYSSAGWYEGERSYKNSGNHMFSNLQFSFGYEHKLNNKTNLRLEPYFKIPVKDVGIGSMPITSMGLYFILTRDIK